MKALKFGSIEQPMNDGVGQRETMKCFLVFSEAYKWLDAIEIDTGFRQILKTFRISRYAIPSLRHLQTNDSIAKSET